MEKRVSHWVPGWIGLLLTDGSWKGLEPSHRAASGSWWDWGHQASGDTDRCVSLQAPEQTEVFLPMAERSCHPDTGCFSICSPTQVGKPTYRDTDGHISGQGPCQMVLVSGPRPRGAVAEATGCFHIYNEDHSWQICHLDTCLPSQMPLLSLGLHQGLTVSCLCPTVLPQRQFRLWKAVKLLLSGDMGGRHPISPFSYRIYMSFQIFLQKLYVLILFLHLSL